jgi:hypothetical protein
MSVIKSSCSMLPEGYTLKGECNYDGRIAFSLYMFTNEDDANTCAREVERQGNTYNGGWMHGRACGREDRFDYTDNVGVRWFAVSF